MSMLALYLFFRQMAMAVHKAAEFTRALNEMEKVIMTS